MAGDRAGSNPVLGTKNKFERRIQILSWVACPGGEIGRRAGLRSLWGNTCRSSSLLSGTCKKPKNIWLVKIKTGRHRPPVFFVFSSSKVRFFDLVFIQEEGQLYGFIIILLG